MVGDLVREQRLSWREIARMGHRELAWRIGGLSPQSTYAQLMGEDRGRIDDPADAQRFVERFL